MDAVGEQERPQVTVGFLQRRADGASGRPGQRREIRYSRLGRIDCVGFDRASPHLRMLVT